MLWKMGETDWQNRCLNAWSYLFWTLDFCSHGKAVRKKNLPVIHTSWAWSQKATTGWQALRLGWLYTVSHSLAMLLSGLKRPWFLENLKFKTVWLLKAPLNAHCGSEQYIITSLVLRWCTEPIYQESAIPLMMYDYNSPLEHAWWCMA